MQIASVIYIFSAMNDLHEKHFSSSTILTFYANIFIIDNKLKCHLQKNKDHIGWSGIRYLYLSSNMQYMHCSTNSY